MGHQTLLILQFQMFILKHKKISKNNNMNIFKRNKGSNIKRE